jgi:hypothetical protein
MLALRQPQGVRRGPLGRAQERLLGGVRRVRRKGRAVMGTEESKPCLLPDCRLNRSDPDVRALRRRSPVDSHEFRVQAPFVGIPRRTDGALVWVIGCGRSSRDAVGYGGQRRVPWVASIASREVRRGDAVRVPGRPLHQLDPVAVRVGEPARPEIVGTVR